jgi:hypothetical protein
MTRLVRKTWEDKPEREAIIFPLSILPYRSYLDIDVPPLREGTTKRLDARRQARKQAPYQPGDIFFAEIARGDIRLIRVLYLMIENNDRRGVFLPYWRSVFSSKDGFWSQVWRDIWPGNVYRAYFNQSEQPRGLPERLHSLDELRSLSQRV